MSTAIGSYATITAVKARLGIEAADTTDDATIASVCDQVNAYIEGYVGRPLCNVGTATYTFDGYDALDNRLLFVKNGLQSVTTLETATYTGGDYNVVPATDYFLRPSEQDRLPGWPATELLMTNIPSAGNTAPLFYNGFATVRVTGVWGFAAIPDDVAEIAEVAAVRAWQARQAGQTDQIGVTETGQPVISRTFSVRDRDTLARYRAKTPARI